MAKHGFQLDETPGWAAVLLTVADITGRPWISVAVWAALIGRAVVSALQRRRANRQAPDQNAGNPPAITG